MGDKVDKYMTVREFVEQEADKYDVRRFAINTYSDGTIKVFRSTRALATSKFANYRINLRDVAIEDADFKPAVCLYLADFPSLTRWR
jgi:hypothetical protein